MLLTVTVRDEAALHAGMEDVNQATIEIRDGQAVLAGPMVRHIRLHAPLSLPQRRDLISQHLPE